MRRKLVSKMNLQDPISIYLNMGLETVSVKCIQCPEEKQSLQELKVHISLDHLAYLPYQCAICEFSVFRPTDGTLKLHVQESHPGQQPKMLYTPDEAKEARLNSLISQSYKAKAAEEGLNLPLALGNAASGNNSSNLPLNNPPLSSMPSSESAISMISEPPEISDFFDEEKLSINDDNRGDTQKISDSRIRRTRSENAAQKEIATSFSLEDPPPASELSKTHGLWVRGSNLREKVPQKSKKSKFEPLTIKLPTLGEQAATNEIMSTHTTVYLCDMCGKRFSIKRKLLRHRRESHASEQQKWRCRICGRKFARRENYLSHLKNPNVHFPCAECGEKSFSSARALQDHVREQHVMSTHTTTYLCNSCGKRFSTERKLLRHRQESHGSEHQKWRCHICGQKFARKDSYLNHLKNPNVHFPCAECGEKCFSARALRDHIWERHGSPSSLINVAVSQSGNEVVTLPHLSNLLGTSGDQKSQRSDNKDKIITVNCANRTLSAQ